jgi:hypothetical protein
MGMTMAQLAENMTAEEFGLHLELEQHEPLVPALEHAVAALLASQANGPMTRRGGQHWSAADFKRAEPWPQTDAAAAPASPAPPPTVAQILKQAHAAGMGG